MIKTLQLKSWLLLLLMLVGVGNAWADDAYYTLDTSVDGNETTSNGYASNGTVTVDGIGWTFNGNGQIQPWRLGGKSLSKVDRVAYTTTAMDAAIRQVDLTVGAASSITVNSLKLVVASDASFNTVIDEVSRTFTASSTISFTPTSGDSWAADAYYKFVFNVTVSVSSNKFVQFSKVEFYQAAADVAVTGVSLNKTETSIVVGGTETLTATVAPDDATNKDVTWTSSDESVATVDGGVVTAVAAGSATITVTTEDGDFTATCDVTVTSGAVAVTGVSLNKENTTLLVGATETLTATVSPNDATNKNVIWESDDEDVATVEDGVVTAVGVGTANITVTTEEGDFMATCVVTVNPVAVESVSLNKTETSITVGATETLTATVTPDNATNKNVTWTSSDESVATVDGGVVTGVAVGTATITVTTTDGGKTATCEVTVAAAPSEETITFSELGYANAAEVTEVNGTNATLTFNKGTSNNAPKYYTSGTAVRMYGGNTMTVTSTKTIEKIELTFGSSDGSNTITTDVDTYSNGTWSGSAKSITFTIGGTSGNRRLSSVKITYAQEGPAVDVIGVTLKESTTLYVGGTETLEATIAPDNATNKNVTWTSSDEEVATVDEDGKVTAVAVGTATITVTTEDGEFTATCEVTVVPVPVESVSLNKTEMTLGIGDSETLTATVSPDNAANKNVTWSSSNTGVATVSNGEVTAVAVGEATITVTTEDGSKTATCVVTVTAPVAVTGVTLDEEELNLYVGGTATLTATIAPAEATNKNVAWTSSDEDVATVENGIVTAVAVGTATITVTTVDGSKTATCAVTVTAAPGTLANPYTVAQAIAAIDAGTGVTGVYATGIVSEIVTVYNSTYGNISYNISADGLTTSDQLQAYRGKSYNGDNFTSEDDIQVGDVVVIYGDLKKYSSTYEFDKDNQLVSLQRKAAAELAYETTSYNANLSEAFATPELTNPNDLTVTYSSSNTDVAIVDENTGAVTLVAAGETTITATFAGNASYQEGSASYTLTVIDPSEPVDICVLNSITPTTLTVGDMDDFALNADFVDGVVEDEDYEISWSSSDTDILELAGATYEAKAAGTVTVTVRVEVLDEETYNNVEKAFEITVKVPKTYVALVAEYDGGYYALTNEAKASNKLVATAVDAVNGKVIGKTDDISWVITEGDGTATIQDVDENYLTGSSSNTNITLGNSEYSWSVDEENHSWYKGTRSFIYHSSGDCFGNYATSNVGKTGYSGYTTAYTFADGYAREVTGGNFGTICLPYDVAAADFSGVKFYQIATKTMNGDKLKSVTLEEVTELVGGAAYLFQANEEATKLVAAYSGSEVDEEIPADVSGTGLTGTYSKQYIPEGMYMLKNGKLYYVDAAEYVYSGANKAYIDLTDVSKAGANVKGIELFSGDLETGIQSVGDETTERVVYNLSGQRVQKPGRGVYVVNGQKIVVK